MLVRCRYCHDHKIGDEMNGPENDSPCPVDHESLAEHGTAESGGPGAPNLTRRSILGGLAAVGGIGAASVCGFAYSGGWLTPDRLTPDRFADRFEQTSGRFPGFRRNHAKGVAATGSFVSTGAGVELSSASVFQSGRVPVTARFSLPGSMPFAPDNSVPVRALGLQFHLPAGEQWRTAMISLPVFTDRTPESLFARMGASKPDPVTGKPDPAAMAHFMARFPDAARVMKIVSAAPVSSGFADATFNGIHAFHFTNFAGRSTPIRWRFVPRDPVVSMPTNRSAVNNGHNFLFDALIARVGRAPVRWDLQLVVGEPGDPTDDATVPWPSERRVVTAGTLSLDQLQTEEPGNARDVNFDPTVLPAGMSISDDPLLAARSAIYSVSFTRRAGERHTPSAVQVPGGRIGV